MMNNTSVLEKVNRRARQIVKANPNIKYRDAQKQAGLEKREGVSGRRKARTAHKGKKKAARTVGAKYRVRHVVEKIGASEVNATRQQLKHQLEQQRAWMLLARDNANSVAEKKRLAKQIAENKKEEKAIGGLKRKKVHHKKRRR
jgi:hypothetical protein